VIAIEILAGEQGAHQQDGGVDARQLDVAVANAGLHVDEVVEEALVPGGAGWFGSLRSIPKETQRGQREIASLGPRTPAAFGAHGIGR